MSFKMRIRLHRGGYAEAMETEAEIEPTCEAITQYLIERGHEGEFSLAYYGMDERRGWGDTHIVMRAGFPVAYTDTLPLELWP